MSDYATVVTCINLLIIRLTQNKEINKVSMWFIINIFSLLVLSWIREKYISLQKPKAYESMIYGIYAR